jgi:putative Mg2+ transporter-C (MgtC) family protein
METLLAYWSADELRVNGLILLHLLGALAVGILIGYERSYHGRAAGLRTYSLVCVASCVLTVICAYPNQWFGGIAGGHAPLVDPTRTIQGILTGIGFLGAGVIMKEGFSIRGLSTAASIWMTAVIGIVIGIGFYGAAIIAALMTVALMSGVRSIENALPHETVLNVSLTFAHERTPSSETIRKIMQTLGYTVTGWNFDLTREGKRFEYHLVLRSSTPHDPGRMAEALEALDGLVEFHLSPARA